MRQHSRRQILKALGVGVATAALPFSLPTQAFGLAPKTAAAPQPAATFVRLPAAAAPWSWVAPLGVGHHVAHGWRVEALSGVEQGRVVLGLRHPLAGTAEVHVHRRDGAARGIAHTRELDLLLMNGARGATPSDEGLGLAILALGRRIERNERAGMVRGEQLVGLERHDRSPLSV
jgi:hypothetical protein